MAKKPGPKSNIPSSERAQRVTYTVDTLTRRKLKVLGEKNESLGVRLAAREAFAQHLRKHQENDDVA